MKGRKLLSIVLIVLMVLVIFSGCKQTADAPQGGEKNMSTEDEGKKTGDDKKPDKKITIKYWVPFTPNQYIQSLNESLMYEELEERTGIHVEFIHPPEGQEMEQFNLIVSDKEMPDVIQTYATSYKGGMDKAIKDGVYLRLNELIDEHAPNFKALLEDDPELARQVTTDEGNIYAFPLVGEDKEEPAWWGPVIREDWLEELSLEEPTTIDEWEEVLKKFKVEQDLEAPLVISTRGIDPYGTIVSAYGIGPGFYREDNTIKYGPMEPKFKEYLETMNKWYAEGLLDNDFATRDYKSREALITSGETGMFITEYALVDQYHAAIKTTDPDAKFAPIIQPSLKPGGTVKYRVVNNRNGGYEAAITTSCEHPEEVAEWFDYAYGEEGYMLFNYGIEGVSYNMVDGKPEFTELLTDNEDGLDFWAVCNKYKLEVGPYLRDYKAVPELTPFDMDAMEKWTIATDEHVIPPVNFTAEEDERYAEIMNDLSTYKDEMVLKFIMGEEPLSKFDEYVEQLKKLRIEEVISIYQTSFDRYMNR